METFGSSVERISDDALTQMAAALDTIDFVQAAALLGELANTKLREIGLRGHRVGLNRLYTNTRAQRGLAFRWEVRLT